MIHLHLHRGRISLHLHARALGEDLNLSLSGGDKEHIGAVAVAVPHAGRDGGSATASVLALPGHKEDLLARRLALRVARHLGVTVAMSCGIHIDAPTSRELEEVDTMADELTATLLAQLCHPLVRPPSP